MRTGNLVFIAILSLLNCQQRSAEQNSTDKDCEKGKGHAREDIRNNTLGLYFFGIPDSRLNTKVRILITQYGIEMKGGGDIVTTEGKCYNEVMETELKRKFGDNFFSALDRKVDSLVAVGDSEREATYPGGKTAIDRYLACNLNFFDLKKQDQKPTIYVELVIDTAGNVKNATVKKGHIKKFDEEALRVLGSMTGWLPAIDKSAKIESRIILQVKFDPNMKAQFDCK